MIKLRAVFEKSGRAKYISHLDLNRCMLRIFRRSKLPIWYTEGFNPHPYISFVLALSLGFESSCELLDFNLNEELPFDEVKKRLNSVMPDGMRILSVDIQQKKITEIAKAEYDIVLKTDVPESLTSDIDKLMCCDEILIDKRTKKGMKTIDIKPFIEISKISSESGYVCISLRLPAGTQSNYNPMLFIDALRNLNSVCFEIENIRRTHILCGNNENFF